MEKINGNSEWMKEWIKKRIEDFTDRSEDNLLGGGILEKAWESPLIGFSRGDDPLYYEYKANIGEFYWTPKDIFSKTYPDLMVNDNELSIISWILPQSIFTKEEQRKEILYPSKRAALARVNGDKFNQKIGKMVVELLGEQGYAAVSPMLSPFWENKRSEKYGYASTWSERHVAHICGLGTFGLSDALITPVGKAIRCGSVVANIVLKPTERKYKKYNEYCLYFSKGICMKCAERCPAKAIDKDGHNKVKCREYQRNVASKHILQEYGLESNYCGICQFGVPCESKVP